MGLTARLEPIADLSVTCVQDQTTPGRPALTYGAEQSAPLGLCCLVPRVVLALLL